MERVQLVIDSYYFLAMQSKRARIFVQLYTYLRVCFFYEFYNTSAFYAVRALNRCSCRIDQEYLCVFVAAAKHGGF